MGRIRLFFAIATLPAFAQGPAVVDRGLPKANVKQAAGESRSNVRWGWRDRGFVGDDFTIGAPGERWVVDSIRTWVVPGSAGRVPARLSDEFQDVRLYFGPESRDLTMVASGDLAEGTDETSNPKIRIANASLGGGIAYDDAGIGLPIWQVEFRGLSLKANGGQKYRFAVWGLGRPIPGGDGKRFVWLNHASNAELGGSSHDGADGKMILFDDSARFERAIQAKGAGWDKNADINVQVVARRVSGPRGSNAR